MPGGSRVTAVADREGGKERESERESKRERVRVLRFGGWGTNWTRLLPV